MQDRKFAKSVRVDGKLLRFRTLIPEKEWEFKGSGNKDWTVKRNGNVNNRERNFKLSCNCPSWIYKNSKAERHCKHCKGIMKSGELRAIDKLSIVNAHSRTFGTQNATSLF